MDENTDSLSDFMVLFCSNQMVVYSAAHPSVAPPALPPAGLELPDSPEEPVSCYHKLVVNVALMDEEKQVNSLPDPGPGPGP